ncbi:hypothetical protein [Psittacicella hinzii]|uniref:hypothetical protein n=1 Tax=Psittacicella hinzii TaxID=2028575 RepID=UPI001FEB874F|nr:hypothetical protein [Psittacicella hinzii]
MLIIGQARQDTTWIGQHADAWLTHGITQENLSTKISELQQADLASPVPFSYGTFVHLLADPDAPLEMPRPRRIRAGSKALVK